MHLGHGKAEFRELGLSWREGERGGGKEGGRGTREKGWGKVGEEVGEHWREKRRQRQGKAERCVGGRSSLVWGSTWRGNRALFYGEKETVGGTVERWRES